MRFSSSLSLEKRLHRTPFSLCIVQKAIDNNDSESLSYHHQKRKAVKELERKATSSQQKEGEDKHK